MSTFSISSDDIAVYRRTLHHRAQARLREKEKRRLDVWRDLEKAVPEWQLDVRSLKRVLNGSGK